MIRLSDVLMRYSPEGAHKINQKHTTQCLQSLAHSSIRTQQLTLQTLRFILHQCTERPLSLRTVDIGCIFLILAKMLSGAVSHEDETEARLMNTLCLSPPPWYDNGVIWSLQPCPIYRLF
ncbi:hypothetical protein BS47DRAFT_51513 [Hydnum rufescens UP504]|uniref:Uncharacterized protein n=1 Tax=Hydnum rufescens UP504 TaxID=1448309 RepID=A0A9P6ARM4_9AGAM|nr:hypothetical protein BS47DRAFT_51513 [Hydnum rufescens UP504]